MRGRLRQFSLGFGTQRLLKVLPEHLSQLIHETEVPRRPSYFDDLPEEGVKASLFLGKFDGAHARGNLGEGAHMATVLVVMKGSLV